MAIVRELVMYGAGHLVLLSMLEHGLAFDRGEVREAFRRPVAWRALVTTILFVPLIAIAVVKAIPLPQVVTVVLVLSAICPGQEMLVFATKRQGGNTHLALALSLVLSTLCIVTVPLWVSILGVLFPAHFHASVLVLMKQISVGLLLPFIIGALFHHWWPAKAERLAPIVEKLFYVALASAALVLLAVGGRQLLSIKPLTLFAALLILMATALIGWMAGGPDARDRTTVGIAALFGNPALVLFVVQESDPDIHLEAPLFAYLLIRTAVMLLFSRWSRARGRTQLPTGAVPA